MSKFLALTRSSEDRRINDNLVKGEPSKTGDFMFNGFQKMIFEDIYLN